MSPSLRSSPLDLFLLANFAVYRAINCNSVYIIPCSYFNLLIATFTFSAIGVSPLVL
jgi:hypothetical protein